MGNPFKKIQTSVNAAVKAPATQAAASVAKAVKADAPLQLAPVPVADQPVYNAPVAAAPKAMDYSGIESAISKGYDYQRQKAAQSESGTLQAQKDAIARKQAQMGGVAPGGAFLKLEQGASDQSAQRLQNANEGINAQQASDMRNIQLTKMGQEFQSSERQAGQDFSAGQAKAAAEYQGAQHAIDMANQNAIHDMDSKIQQDQFGKQMDFSYKQFQQSQKVDDWNHALAEKMANQKDPLEKLLNPGGSLPGIGGDWGSWKDVATGGAFNPLGVAGEGYGAAKKYGSGIIPGN